MVNLRRNPPITTKSMSAAWIAEKIASLNAATSPNFCCDLQLGEGYRLWRRVLVLRQRDCWRSPIQFGRLAFAHSAIELSSSGWSHRQKLKLQFYCHQASTSPVTLMKICSWPSPTLHSFTSSPSAGSSTPKRVASVSP